jgi:uncharacterized protein DUF3592
MDEQHVLIIVGAVAISYGLVSALRLKGSRSWPSVEGRIVRSIKRLQHTDAGKLEDADIAYQYDFGEKTYTSKVIKIGGDMLSQPSRRTASEADLLLTKYPPGKVVDVYVNPKHPKVACLEKAGGETVFISIFFGLMAVLAGLYFDGITSLIHRSVTWLRK